VAIDRSCLWMGIDVFFFSSRRRHTRSYGDWSSDVCSSDLTTLTGRLMGPPNTTTTCTALRNGRKEPRPRPEQSAHGQRQAQLLQIGRASCRERVENSEVRVVIENKTKKKERTRMNQRPNTT